MISLDNSCFARMIFGKSVKAEFHSPFMPLLLVPVCSRQIHVQLGCTRKGPRPVRSIDFLSASANSPQPNINNCKWASVCFSSPWRSSSLRMSLEDVVSLNIPRQAIQTNLRSFTQNPSCACSRSTQSAKRPSCRANLDSALRNPPLA